MMIEVAAGARNAIDELSKLVVADQNVELTDKELRKARRCISAVTFYELVTSGKDKPSKLPETTEEYVDAVKSFAQTDTIKQLTGNLDRERIIDFLAAPKDLVNQLRDLRMGAKTHEAQAEKSPAMNNGLKADAPIKDKTGPNFNF